MRSRFALPGVALAGFAAGMLVTVAIYTAVATEAGTLADATPPRHQAQMGLQGTSAQQLQPGFQRDMNAAMARMMQDMHVPGYSGNADIDFLAMMIPHHAGAIEMARLELQHGRDPASRQLAQDILAGQQIEIEGMTRRLVALRQGGQIDAGQAFPALGGTRGP